jgi:hypothetical protein
LEHQQRLLGSGHDACVVERPAPMRAAPGDALALVELEEQIELGPAFKCRRTTAQFVLVE